jgi:tRNA 2-thiouridine synthesizing protein A
MSLTVAQSLDLKGLSCPLPIIKTAQAVKQMATGDLIEIVATDPGSAPDFDAWCRTTGNELVERTEESGVYRFLVRKG